MFDLAELVLEHPALDRFLVEIANRSGTLAGHQGAVLVGVDGVAA
jgi:hypothetical protein